MKQHVIKFSIIVKDVLLFRSWMSDNYRFLPLL